MHRVGIIAEIGSSHSGSLDSAFRLIEESAKAGADIVKFQLFTGDDLWHPSDKRLIETRRLAVPREWIPKLKKRCLDLNVRFLCTPFSPTSVEYLESQGVRQYKVASGDITYTPLLESLAKTKKLVYLSTGASTFEEIDQALSILKDNKVVVLHCVPEYPSSPKTANVSRMLDLIQRYSLDKREIPVGLSSHLREWWVDVATCLYKTNVIEKHISLEGRQGPEASHSLDPLEFALFVAAVRDMEQALEVPAGFTTGEQYARDNYRRNSSDWLRPAKR